MSVWPCDRVADCQPCDENPVMNITAADPDPVTFLSMGYALPPADIGKIYVKNGCLSWCFSAVSQEEAELCALRQAALCDGKNFPNRPRMVVCHCPDGRPIPFFIRGGLFFEDTEAEADADALSYACQQAQANCGRPLIPNESTTCTIQCLNGRLITVTIPEGIYYGADQQDANDQAHQFACLLAASDCPGGGDGVYPTTATCTVRCPDGTPFTYTLPANVIFGRESDAAAYACFVAEQHKICLSNIPKACCAGSAYLETIEATGGALAQFPHNNFWEITSGAVPPGLTFMGGFTTDAFAMIQGTPTTAGQFTFTVKITVPNGDHQLKSYTVSVIKIDNASPLPPAVINTPYFVQLTASGGSGNYQWSVLSGGFPNGLALGADSGAISGTPTVSGTFNVEIGVTDLIT